MLSSSLASCVLLTAPWQQPTTTNQEYDLSQIQGMSRHVTHCPTWAVVICIFRLCPAPRISSAKFWRRAKETAPSTGLPKQNKRLDQYLLYWVLLLILVQNYSREWEPSWAKEVKSMLPCIPRAQSVVYWLHFQVRLCECYALVVLRSSWYTPDWICPGCSLMRDSIQMLSSWHMSGPRMKPGGTCFPREAHVTTLICRIFWTSNFFN
jgi:hypothetical protein